MQRNNSKFQSSRLQVDDKTGNMENMKTIHIIYMRYMTSTSSINLPHKAHDVMRAILITDKEFAVYENCGMLRLLSNIGFQ